MTERILVTGGTGFIGSHLVGKLARRDCRITVLSRQAVFCYPQALPGNWQERVRLVQGDLRCERLVKQLVLDSDVIFHKAASVGVERSAEISQEFAETNVGGAANIAQILRHHRHDVKRIILDSSISVYGEGNYSCAACGTVRPAIRYTSVTGTIGSSDRWNPPCPRCKGPLNPEATPEDAERLGESVYAVTKKGQEDLLTSACNLTGIPLIILRYCTAYGPGQRTYNPYTRFLRRLAGGQAPVIHEDGKQSRDFVYIDDIIDANLKALDSNPDGRVVLNVGSGTQTTVYDFAHALSETLCRQLEKETIEPAIDHSLVPGDVRHCYADCKLLFSQFGHQAKTALADGIEKLVAWHRHDRHSRLDERLTTIHDRR